MSSLLPPNATQVEKDLEASTERIGNLPVDIRKLWNPDTCPEELLPWLAWAMSIDSWKPYWPIAVKRQRVKDAIEIQRRKGTAGSVRAVVESFGAGLAIREWWDQTPAGTPHTFDVVLTIGGSVPNTAAYQQDIIDEITRTKPVRSHFSLNAGISLSGGIGLQGVVRPVIYSRIEAAEV